MIGLAEAAIVLAIVTEFITRKIKRMGGTQ